MKQAIVAGIALTIFCLVLVSASWGDKSSVQAETEVVTDQASQPKNETVSQDIQGSESLTGMLLPSLTRIGISLLVIIGVIYALVFILRRFSGRQFGGRGKRTIQVVEQTFLAPKKSICLLKMADRALLVGVTDSNINLLTEMPWDELPEKSGGRFVDKTNGFQDFLNNAAGRLLGGGKNKGARHEQVS